MKEMVVNMMTLVGKVEMILITTNGFVTTRGECVMGRGIAAQMKALLPSLPTLLGKKIKANGNKPQCLTKVGKTILCSFPVKPVSLRINSRNEATIKVVQHMQDMFTYPWNVPGWACKADIEIITNSAKYLKEQVDKTNIKEIYCPRFGCGAGELDWSTIKPIVDQYLDDRFIACTY